MKIAYDYKIFWNQKYGGISRYFINLFKNLEKKKIEFKVFSPLFKNIYLRELNKKNLQGIEVRRIIPYTSFLYKRYNDIACNYNLEKWEPDLIHHTYYSDKKIIKKKPLIVTVYDLIHEKISDQKGKIHLEKKESINAADKIICISNDTKKDLLHYYNINEKKISVIHLGGDHLLNLKHQPNLRTKTKKNLLNKPFLLYVGSRNKYKNFQFFLKGISISKKINKDFDIVLFGGGNLTIEEKLTISKLQLENKFITVSGDDQSLSNYYKNAELFIFPSIFEGFGLPMIEAMSFGCPVLCSNNLTFQEIAGDCVTYFDPFDIEDFKFQIENLIDSKSKLKELSASSIKRSKNFTWEQCTDKTVKIYKQFI